MKILIISELHRTILMLNEDIKRNRKSEIPERTPHLESGEQEHWSVIYLHPSRAGSQEPEPMRVRGAD